MLDVKESGEEEEEEEFFTTCFHDKKQMFGCNFWSVLCQREGEAVIPQCA